MGQECQYYQDCFVMKARREAQQADVVVVNHHLFFADVALKDNGVAELLPSANTIIFDEAHQLPDTATLFFGKSVSTSQVLELCRDVLAEGLAHARGGVDWAKTVTVVEKAARDLRLTFPQDNMRLSLPQIAESSPFFAALDKLKEELAGLIEVLEGQAERAESIEQCRVRAIELLAAYDDWKSRATRPCCGWRHSRPRCSCTRRRCRSPRSFRASAPARRVAGSSPRPRWR
jgi:ATP-dependent DNA helicase DinG